MLVSSRPDAQAAVVELEAGALDLISVGLPVTDMIRLKNDASYQVLINDRSGSSFVAVLNCTRAPTDNNVVRQALSYALDRQRMADAVWHAYNLETARTLLEQAGVTTTHVDIVWSIGPPELATLAQIYQADLARLGFKVALRPLAAAGYLPIVNSFR